MSIEAISWALSVPVGGNQKVVLLGLANHAHPDGTEAYPALDRLSSYAHCDRSTARRNVQKLVDSGWIREDGTGPRGQNKYSLSMGPEPFQNATGGETPPVAPAPPGGGTSASEGVAPMPPEPSIEPSSEPSVQPAARDTADPADVVPPDFPAELRPHARSVMTVLKAIAAENPNCRRVTARELALSMMAHRNRAYVAEALAFRAWAPSASRPIKNAVASYRNWLKNANAIEGLERLDEDGMPATAVRQQAGRRMSNADRVDANVEALAAFARHSGGGQ